MEFKRGRRGGAKKKKTREYVYACVREREREKRIKAVGGGRRDG